MKKLLIATAAMAMVAGAQAQSSVTVYGILDLNYTSNEVNKAGANTVQSNNSLGDSRIGLKGTEDLGGGLKAEFQLEGTLNPNTGKVGYAATTGTATDRTDQMFNREAWVGFTTANFGSVRFGQTDVTSAQAIDNTVSQAADLGKSADLGADTAQTIRYTTPTIAGFTAQVGYSNPSGSSTAEGTAGSIKSGYVEYVAGSLAIYAGQTSVKVSNTSADQQQTSFGVKYDFGTFSIGAFQSKSDNNTKSGQELKQTRITAAAPVSALGSGVKVHAVYFKDDISDNASSFTNTATSSAVKETNGYKLALTKAFSKRTTGYTAYVVTNDGLPNQRTNDAKAYVVGVSHSF